MYDLTKCLNLFTLVCLAVLTVYSAPTMAQNCTKRHIQEIYCNADYIAVISTYKRTTYEDSEVENEIDVFETLKLTPAGNKTLRESLIYTPLKDKWNFIKLYFDQYYLIAGKGDTLNKCDYVEEVERNARKNAFSEIDPYVCACKVETCSDNKCDMYAKSRTGCKWSPNDICATEVHDCSPKVRWSRQGFFTECSWDKTPKWQKCISDNSFC